MATLNTIFAKKIPTILGLVFLVAGLGVAVYMVGGSTSSFFPRASPETAPRNIKVTNVSANQFTISFVTDTETSAFVRYGSSANQITSRAADDRELTSGVQQKSTTHHITAKGLNPSTTYYFLIGTGTNTMYNDAGQPYQVTTGPNLGSTPQAVTLSGKVETEGGTSAEDSLVYVTAQNGAALSSWVRRTGFFAIPLSNARTTDFKAYLNPGENTPISIFVQGFNGQTASSTINLPKDGNIAESIVLGVSGESQRAAPVLDEDGMPGMPSDSGAPGESAFTNAQLNPAVEVPGTEQSSSTESGDLTITTIPADGTVLTETKPTIEGIAPPNTQLQIQINSTPSYNLTANTDADGNFTITPPGNLAPGQHTLTISYVDANGATQTTRRTFLVQANGTATSTGARGTTSTPSYTSSPSGTTRNGTSTATGTATPRPTATPGTGATATGAAVPVAGTPAQTALILIAGLFMVYGGIFLSKKLVQESATEIPDNP